MTQQISGANVSVRVFVPKQDIKHNNLTQEHTS